jgi:hypothetical protein
VASDPAPSLAHDLPDIADEELRDEPTDIDQIPPVRAAAGEGGEIEVPIFEDSAVHVPAARAPAARSFDAKAMVEVPDAILNSIFGGTHAVKRFLLDRAPVTNAQYAEFLQATGETPPAHWLGGRPPANKPSHPVVGISRAQAARYAEFRGKRLPTALEWEAAVQGTDGRRFPWGDSYDAGACHGIERGVAETVAVASLPAGVAACGAHDLVGNVWEWTVDADGMTPPEPGYAWVFGGSYKHRCEQDGHFPRTSVAVGKSYEYLGFRCAADEGKHARR